MSRTATSPAAPAVPTWMPFGDGRDQLAAAADCAVAMFRGFEAMHKVQLEAANAAARQHAAAASRFKQGCTAADVAAIQMTLAKSQLEGATQYWQQLAATATEMQARMLGAWNEAIDAGAVLEGLSALAGRPH